MPLRIMQRIGFVGQSGVHVDIWALARRAPKEEFRDPQRIFGVVGQRKGAGKRISIHASKHVQDRLDTVVHLARIDMVNSGNGIIRG